MRILKTMILSLLCFSLVGCLDKAILENKTHKSDFSFFINGDEIKLETPVKTLIDLGWELDGKEKDSTLSNNEKSFNAKLKKGDSSFKIEVKNQSDSNFPKSIEDCTIYGLRSDNVSKNFDLTLQGDIKIGSGREEVIKAYRDKYTLSETYIGNGLSIEVSDYLDVTFTFDEENKVNQIIAASFKAYEKEKSSMKYLEINEKVKQ